MSTTRARRLPKWAALFVAGVTIFAASAAVASVPDGNTINACRRTSSGALRVIDRAAGQRCGSGETALDWKSLSWRGQWSAAIDYRQWDVVYSNGTSYIARYNPAPGLTLNNYFIWRVLAKGGAAGAVGPQGPAGADGAPGADGAVGPQGPAGADGANGADGAPGADGVNGLDGAPGADGAPGPQGPQGPAGVNGVDGAPGPVGPAGPAGPAGMSFLMGGGAGRINANTTTYTGSGSDNTTESYVWRIVPYDMTFGHLYCSAAKPSGASSATFTVRVTTFSAGTNSSASVGASCVVPAGSTSGMVATPISITAGQAIDVLVVTGNAAGGVSWALGA